MDFLGKHGYRQYEVSNFAKPAKQCRHNSIYWRGDEYVSLGPSAHGYVITPATDVISSTDSSTDSASSTDSTVNAPVNAITLPANLPADRIHTRYWNARSLKRYTDSVRAGTLPITNTEQLTTQERLFERAFLELRSQGIRLGAFERDFGIDLRKALHALFRKYDGEKLWQIHALVEHASVEQAEEQSEERLALTSRGYALCDNITTDVLAALEQHTGTRWKEAKEIMDTKQALEGA
jgi:coproporphyrinogen III oxidase-like Fe-S oxidoreductase